MKKILSLFLLLFCIFSLFGCSSASDSLDKNDAKILAPLDYEYTDVITYDSFSKAIMYQAINDVISNAKLSISTVATGISTDGVAIITIDKKTGEGIGACKTTVKGTSPLSGYNGTSMSYIRGYKSYTDCDFTLYYNYNGKKTMSYKGKYYMDIPVTDEKGVGSFFGDNAAENAYLTNPYEIIKLLEDSELVKSEGNTFKKARVDGYTFYKLEFGTEVLQGYGNYETEIVIKMSGRKVIGVRTRVVYPDGADGRNSLMVNLVPFKGNLDVPTEFTGYDKTMDQFFQDLTQSMMSLSK